MSLSHIDFDDQIDGRRIAVVVEYGNLYFHVYDLNKGDTRAEQFLYRISGDLESLRELVQ